MRTELKKNEKKILETRRHIFVLIKPLFLAIIFTAVTIGLCFYKPGPEIFYGSLLIALFFVLRFCYKVMDRKADIWIVTDMRVIDEAGVFSRIIKESPLDKINNVSYQQTLMGRMFNYGMVGIQTAAEYGSTMIKFAISPKLLRDTIVDVREKYIHLQAGSRRSKPILDPDTKKCPYCAEMIKAEAKVCRYCRKELEPATSLDE